MTWSSSVDAAWRQWISAELRAENYWNGVIDAPTYEVERELCDTADALAEMAHHVSQDYPAIVFRDRLTAEMERLLRVEKRLDARAEQILFAAYIRASRDLTSALLREAEG